MLDRNINTPLTSSMGRLFDAVAALLGLCWEASHEAQAAIALENAAVQGATGQAPYVASVRAGQVPLAPLFAQLVDDLRAGRSTADMAWRFHRTVAQMAVDMARYTQTHSTTTPACNTVALSGGVWQNRLLLELTVPLLRAAGFEVLLPRSVPANDGGIAYGQAAIAAARLASSAEKEAEAREILSETPTQNAERRTTH